MMMDGIILKILVILLGINFIKVGIDIFIYTDFPNIPAGITMLLFFYLGFYILYILIINYIIKYRRYRKHKRESELETEKGLHTDASNELYLMYIKKYTYLDSSKNID